MAPKKEKKPKSVVDTFLFLVNVAGVLLIVISNFVSMCQLQISTDPQNETVTALMKSLGFRGPGFGVHEGIETNEWQKDFRDGCPPPPTGYNEAAWIVGGKVAPGKLWKPAAIALVVVLINLLVLGGKKKQQPVMATA